MKLLWLPKSFNCLRMHKSFRFFKPLTTVVVLGSPTLALPESIHYLLIYNLVKFLRPLAIVVVPDSLILLLLVLFHCLPMYKWVRFFRSLAIAIVPESLILLSPELIYSSLMNKIVRFLRFYETKSAPLSPIPKYQNQCVPIPPIFSYLTFGSCMSITVSFSIVSSALSKAVNPPIVKVFLSPSAVSIALPRSI
jgi:hypothetical protein